MTACSWHVPGGHITQGASSGTCSATCRGLGLTERWPSSRGLLGWPATFRVRVSTCGRGALWSDNSFCRFSAGPSMTSARQTTALHIKCENCLTPCHIPSWPLIAQPVRPAFLYERPEDGQTHTHEELV